MGGIVKVIFREENGTIHKQERHTNSLPLYVKCEKFLDKEYLKENV